MILYTKRLIVHPRKQSTTAWISSILGWDIPWYPMMVVLQIPRRWEEIKWLEIGGYELAFHTNLVASYLFKNSTVLLNQIILHSIYRNNGLVAFKVKKSTKEIKYWLSEFQKSGQGSRKPTPTDHRRNLDKQYKSTPFCKEGKGSNRSKRKIPITRYKN